jgi:TPR repeat protein
MMLGSLYGLEQDHANAMRCYRKAAEQGFPSGQTALANCYQHGLGVLEDDIEAVKWYRKAAEQGDDMAKFKLACCYADGEGVAQDLIIAYMWANLGSASGNRFAVSAKEILSKKLNRDQIAEGQKLSREWKPTK